MKKKLILLAIVALGVYLIFAMLGRTVKLSALTALFAFALFYINKNRKFWSLQDQSKIKNLKNKLKLEVVFYLNIIFSIGYLVALCAILVK